MIKKLIFSYKKDGRLSSVRLGLNKKEMEKIGINKENPFCSFVYTNGEITISSTLLKNEEYNTNQENVVFLSKNTKVEISTTCKLLIPAELVSIMGDEVEVRYLDKKVSITKIKTAPLPATKGRIFVIKVNKGGVGKTFTTVQLAHYLSLSGKRVMILTSDSQNNILNYTGKEDFFLKGYKGIKEFVKGGEGEIIKLRENLWFIPTESSTFGSQFLKNLPNFLEKLRKEYDYILIDSIPTMKIDSVFVQAADRIIIPGFADSVTINGIVNVILEAGADKVLAVLMNKFENKKIQKELMLEISNTLKDTTILFPEPIKNLSDIQTSLHRGRTIWESSSTKLNEVKSSFLEIGNAILEDKNKNNNTEEDFDFDFEI